MIYKKGSSARSYHLSSSSSSSFCAINKLKHPNSASFVRHLSTYSTWQLPRTLDIVVLTVKSRRSPSRFQQPSSPRKSSSKSLIPVFAARIYTISLMVWLLGMKVSDLLKRSEAVLRRSKSETELELDIWEMYASASILWNRVRIGLTTELQSCGHCSYCLKGKDIFCYERNIYGDKDFNSGTFGDYCKSMNISYPFCY